MITDTRQIELLFEEIESYSTPNSLPTKLDTFEHHLGLSYDVWCTISYLLFTNTRE